MTSSSAEVPQTLGKTKNWWVVSKPAGWLTIPGRSGVSVSPILVQWLKEQDPAIWVVHRLDRETSGVVLFARTAEDHARANTWFQTRKVKKVYQCLASGHPYAPFFKVNLPIEGSPCLTQIEVLEKFREGFLARVQPRTGRRHQIRIHMTKSGFPIWGDTLYQGLSQIQFPDSVVGVSRVALHAAFLELPTGEKYEAQLPPDMSGWLEALRRHGSHA